MRVFRLVIAFISACAVFAAMFLFLVLMLSSMHFQLTEGTGLLASWLLIAPFSALLAFGTCRAIAPRRPDEPIPPHEAYPPVRERHWPGASRLRACATTGTLCVPIMVEPFGSANARGMQCPCRNRTGSK